MCIKVVITILFSLCLSLFGHGDETVCACTGHSICEIEQAVFSLSSFNDDSFETTAAVSGSMSSNLNFSGSDKHKSYKTSVHAHGDSHDVSDPLMNRACRHSRPLSSMGLLRHLILLEKILV